MPQVAVPATPAPPPVSKPPSATGSFQYRPSSVNEDVTDPSRPDPPLAMFHIDRFEPLRAASRITFRKLPVEPVYSTGSALAGLSGDRTPDPFDWRLIEALLATPEATVVEEVVEEPQAALDSEPPMAPAWDPPIPFAEWSLDVPKLVANADEAFPGLVIRPVMPTVAIPIRTPQPHTSKVATPVPDTGLGAVRKPVLLERPAAWSVANGLAQPSILREWQSWRPVLDPVRAPQVARRAPVPVAAERNGVVEQPHHNVPAVNEIAEAPHAAPPPQHHEVVINLAALGLLDDPN
jgi:hypothetical protein